METKQINREITAELIFEYEERLLLRKAGSADYVEAPFKRFKKNYTPENIRALSKMLKTANRIGVFTGAERRVAGDLAIEMQKLADELN